MRYPRREPCAGCGEEVVLAMTRSGPLQLEQAELIPAPCPRCRGKQKGCYLCQHVEELSLTATVVLLGKEGGACVGTLLDRCRGDAVHRRHRCSVRAAA